VVHDPTFEERKDHFMANFRQDSLTQFISRNPDKKKPPRDFFDKVDRIYIVEHICYNARFAEGPHGVGLRTLLYEGAYVAGYPLHDGSVKLEPEEQPTNDRQRLKRDWAR